MGKRRHAASGRLGRGCPRLRLGPQKARAAPPPASSLQLFRRRRAALRQAAAALHHTRCTCRAACRLRVPVEHAADRRLRGRKITGLPARARHDERRAPPWPVRSRAYHLKRAPNRSKIEFICYFERNSGCVETGGLATTHRPMENRPQCRWNDRIGPQCAPK